MGSTLTVQQLLNRFRDRERQQLAALMKYSSEYKTFEKGLFQKNGDAFDRNEAAKHLWEQLSYLGSHDLAYLVRGFEGVPYSEIVMDVGEKVEATVVKSNSIEENELEIISKLVGDTWKKMSREERKILLEGMNYDYSRDDLDKLVPPFLLAGIGGLEWFAISRLASFLLAGVLTSIIEGAAALGLAAGTAAIGEEAVAAVLGPVGIVLAVGWLAHLAMGSAYKKTVPSVLFLALMRQIIKGRGSIGLVGTSNTGKDTFGKRILNLDANPSCLPGSTDKAKIYALDGSTKDSEMVVINNPGFDDARLRVATGMNVYIHETRLFVQLFNIQNGIRDKDLELYEKIKEKCQLPGIEKLLIFNHADGPRSSQELDALVKQALKYLGVTRKDVLVTALDPDPRCSREELLSRKLDTVNDVRVAIVTKLHKTGLDPSLVARRWGPGALKVLPKLA